MKSWWKMCGIAGKYYFDKNKYYVGDLPRMMKVISHRGPDSSGTFTDSRTALGFQRLSIIDIATGDQPLYNETKRIVLVANGEIYNFRELRAMLQSSGHIFKTNSDCEVIIHLYEEYGNNFVEKLNGMFAFCLYDSEQQLLLIARDRTGIKPLYYCHAQDVFIFASEIKGILAADGISARPETNVLDEFFCFGSLCNGRTFFSGIKAIEAGSFMEITSRSINSRKYWRPQLTESTLNENQLVERIESSLYNSVQRQMVSDVPLASLLSGGVDSGWISAIAGKLMPELKTFTVGFHEQACNETPYSHLLAKSFELDYHDLIIGNREFADALPQAIWHYDEPLTFAVSVQINLICKYARQFVKVLLSGQGSDELFGGYWRQYKSRMKDQFLSFNETGRRIIMQALLCMPYGKIKRLQQYLALSPYELVLWNAAFAAKDKIAWLFDKEELDISHRMEELNKVWNKDLDILDNMLLFDQRTYLQALLTMQDKMSMATAMELRVPILDNEMISLAHTIPGSMKLKLLQTKYLFKKAAARNIPKKIVYKKKIGFLIPLGDWLKDKNGLGRYLDQLIDTIDNIDGINKTKAEKMIMEHKSGLKDHANILWSMINYVIWQQKFIS
jgi:asparagine synthase (glutamine-hydrolysing)